MKVLKIIGIVIGSIIVLLVVVSLFLPSKATIERSVVIKAPVGTIFNQVNSLKTWEKWSPWYKMDTTMKLEYSTPDTGVNAYYSWDSKEKHLGTGKNDY